MAFYGTQIQPMYGYGSIGAAPYGAAPYAGSYGPAYPGYGYPSSTIEREFHDAVRKIRFAKNMVVSLSV